MKKKILAISCSISALLFACVNANAALIGGQDIIAAPAIVDDAAVTNTQQQAFNEAQDVLLPAPISVDGGGTIATGTMVDSHMIFFNTEDDIQVDDFLVDWTFDGMILGVMSDQDGTLEEARDSDTESDPGTSDHAAFRYWSCGLGWFR